MDPTHLIREHGYWLLVLGCLLEGETVLALAGMAAHRGDLSLPWVLTIAAACAFASDQFLFWLGRKHGPAVLAHVPRLAVQAGRVHQLIERYHGWVVVGVRFAYGLRLAGPVVIGTSALPARRFVFFNALGAVLWAGLVAGLGWVFGQALESVFGEMRWLEALVFIAVPLAAAGYGLWCRSRCSTARAEPGGR